MVTSDREPESRGSARRRSAPRTAVAQLIADREGPFTAADLIAEASHRRLAIGRATIFRALELFTRANAIERLELPSGDHAYVRCAPSHHHHLVCSACGRTADLADAALDSAVEDAGRRAGYTIERHRIELFGLCPSCRARP